jgi:hypothetical protein
VRGRLEIKVLRKDAALKAAALHLSLQADRKGREGDDREGAQISRDYGSAMGGIHGCDSDWECDLLFFFVAALAAGSEAPGVSVGLG